MFDRAIMRGLKASLAAAAMVAAGWASSASAAVVPAGGIGTTFAYDFAQTTAGVNLSATSDWKLTGYSTSGSNALWTFDVVVKNTTAPQAGTNRLSTWGFNTDPEATWDSSTPVTGWSFDDGNVPSLGSFQVCATAGPNCSGGASGGLLEGNSQLFSFTIRTAMADPLEFTSLYVRYQSIGTSGASTAFTGTERASAVPLPAPVLLLLGGMAGLGVVARRRKAAQA